MTLNQLDTQLHSIWNDAGESPVDPACLEALHRAAGIRTGRRRAGGTYWKAAGVAVLALVAIGEFAMLMKPVETTETVSLVTAPSSKGDFYLPDGSHVWLNADSRLSYKTSSPRSVTLQGEAFFDVTRDGSDFTVKTKDLDIKVLGTRFNVRSNPLFGQDQVSLLSGKVEVGACGTTQQLQPGEKVEFADGALTKRTADVTIDACWTGEEIVFQNAPLNDILESLEHWYSINFQTSSGLGLSQRLSFTIRKESPAEAMTILRRLTGCKFKILDDNNILVTK